jgi:hypothetical protein
VTINPTKNCSTEVERSISMHNSNLEG